MRHRPALVFAAVVIFGLMSCSGWCAGCSDIGSGTMTFTDGGCDFAVTARCSFPALPHPPSITVTAISCDGG